MILAIDVGNSNIVIGCCEDGKIAFSERISTSRENTALEYAISFKTILELYNIKQNEIDGAIISSVVPSVTTTIKLAIKKIAGIDAKIVGPGTKTGLNIIIDNPAQLGSDLVVDAVAGISEYKLPLIIFDMGTATTASVIDSKGSYLGGMIIPGVNVSLNALTAGTSQLPKINLEPPKKVISSNTVDCMKSGIIFGQASLIDGVIDRFEEELGQKCTVIVTGGLSGSIIPYCKRKVIHDKDLLLKGLIKIYEKNK